MQDPLDAIRKTITCPFCQKRFEDKVKLIPDCGKFICGICYDYLQEDPGAYECRGCGKRHSFPQGGMADCTQVLDLIRHPIEKPLSPQAKQLKLLIAKVQDEMARLEAFDSREFIEQHCDQLVADVTEASESAIKHIKEIEKDLCQQITEYRQRCLDAMAAATNNVEHHVSVYKTKCQLYSLTKEIGGFGNKWQDYFERLNAFASESQLQAAIDRSEFFQSRMRDLDQEMRTAAFDGPLIHFNPNLSFGTEAGHLGGFTGDLNRRSRNRKLIQLTPSATMTGHSGEIWQLLFLPEGYLASCSADQTIKVWDTTNLPEAISLQGHRSAVESIAVLPNGWLASGSADCSIMLWDLASGKAKTVRGHQRSIVSLNVLRNGNLVSYSTDDTIKVWNPLANANNLLQTITGHGNWKWSMPLGVLSNDLLVTCSRDADDQEYSTMRVWCPDSGTIITEIATGVKRVNSVVVLSNDQVAIGTSDAVIMIIDLQDELKKRWNYRAHQSSLNCMLKLSNDNLVTSGEDRGLFKSVESIKVWNFQDLSLLQHIKTDHSRAIRSLSLSPDETLLTSGSDDATIKLWPISISAN